MTVRTEAELRAIVGEPHPVVTAKVGWRLDDVAAAFVAASPLVVLGTAGADGSVDVSPRGDPPGRVLVLDGGRTVALPERAGNRRLDSATNVLARAQVSLLFLVPGVPHVLRVFGHARLVDDPEVLARWDELGGAPPLALLVEVTEQFVHCGRALATSGVWDPATWADPGEVPGVAALADGARAL